MDGRTARPDFVITMAEPYVVADDSYDVNASFDVPLTDVLPNDVWVRGWELRTGADGRGVASHVCVPETGRRRGRERGE